MGQTYSVTYHLKPKDEKEVIRLLNEFIKEQEWKDDVYDSNSLEGVMKYLITEDGFVHEGDEYRSCFDGTYGYETVLLDIFSVLEGALEDGSYCEIYPDSGFHYGEMVNGKVQWDYEEEAGEEE